jgi:hypothetical protein
MFTQILQYATRKVQEVQDKLDLITHQLLAYAYDVNYWAKE